jgi:hypothetical protein
VVAVVVALAVVLVMNVRVVGLSEDGGLSSRERAGGAAKW